MEADVLPKLAHARVFSVVDVKNGYWHVKLDQQASKLTTFGTPYGRYRWARLPFGVSVAQELFQRKLDKELEGPSNVAKIADDVLVWGNGQDANEAYPDHDAHMSHLLRKMDAAGVKLNPEKLVNRRRKVILAGYVLSDEGHTPDPSKVSPIAQMERPSNVTELRRFCGMVNYLAKFVDRLATLMEPLRQLTCQSVRWSWEHEHTEAFERIKAALISAPLLAYFDPAKEATLQCDASQYGLGAALLQEGRPIAYASRSLSETERSYAQIEKELLSVLFAMERFDMYTYGRPIHVHSDHQPLQTIVRKPLAAALKHLQRMLLRMQRYDFTLQYKKGSELYLADTLSRLHPSSTDKDSVASVLLSPFEKSLRFAA